MPTDEGICEFSGIERKQYSRKMSRIRSELLNVLRCPVTAGRLHQEGDELISDRATATGEFPHYSVHDGIAILLPSENNPIAAGDNESR